MSDLKKNPIPLSNRLIQYRDIFFGILALC
jgi:hypothetical protein